MSDSWTFMLTEKDLALLSNNQFEQVWAAMAVVMLARAKEAQRIAQTAPMSAKEGAKA